MLAADQSSGPSAGIIRASAASRVRRCASERNPEPAASGRGKSRGTGRALPIVAAAPSLAVVARNSRLVNRDFIASGQWKEQSAACASWTVGGDAVAAATRVGITEVSRLRPPVTAGSGGATDARAVLWRGAFEEPFRPGEKRNSRRADPFVHLPVVS